MDMKNWNVDKTQIAAQQEALKKSMNFAYVGHGPKATGFMAKQFKRKPGLYARCVQCGYYMPLDAKGEEIELKDDEDDYIPGMRDEMSYKSDDDEITGSGFTIEDVPVEEDDSLGAFGDAGDDDYTDDSDKEEE